MTEKTPEETEVSAKDQYYFDCAMDTVLVLRHPLPKGRGRSLAALMGDDLPPDAKD